MAGIVSPDTPMGANVVPGGATFRVWAPTANAVHVALLPPGESSLEAWTPSEDNKLIRDANGYWSRFFANVDDGWQYRYWTVGPAGSGYKRDPRACELEFEHYPDCHCVVRKAANYPWHDAGFRPPAFNDLIIYQLHIGVFYARDNGVDIRANRVSKFLD